MSLWWKRLSLRLKISKCTRWSTTVSLVTSVGPDLGFTVAQVIQWGRNARWDLLLWHMILARVGTARARREDVKTPGPWASRGDQCIGMSRPVCFSDRTLFVADGTLFMWLTEHCLCGLRDFVCVADKTLFVWLTEPCLCG